MNSLNKIKLRLELEKENGKNSDTSDEKEKEKGIGKNSDTSDEVNKPSEPKEAPVKKEDNKRYKTIIIISVIAGVVFIAGITISIILLYKYRRKGKLHDSDVNEISKDNSNNFASQNNINEV